MKILVLSNLVSYTYNFRKELIDALVADGHEVVIANDNDDDGKWKELEKEARLILVPFNGKGTAVKEEWKLLMTYRKLLKAEKPDFVLSFTIKMNLYGGLVSSSRKIPFVPMITGLGELEKEGKLRALLLLLHRYVMPRAKCVVFQNEDNRRFFSENHIRTKESRVVPGSGINLEKFQPLPYPEGDAVHFTFIGRLTEAKGIREYLEAAEKMASSQVVFHAAGKVDEGFRPEVERLSKEGKLSYEGILSDVRPLLLKTSCLVLPTYHPEGISNVLLEASAAARPAVCTGRTGCKEIVTDGRNGLWCKAKDTEDLMKKLQTFLDLPLEKRKKMGALGRKTVEEKFDRRIVVEAYREILS